MEYIGQRMLNPELPDRKKRGRPHRRFKEVIMKAMQRVRVTEEETRGRVRRSNP